MFTTAQAAKALTISPSTLRKHRERKGIGTEAMPGRIVYTFEEMEVLRREQGYHKPKWLIRFKVEQLKCDALPGRFIVWADSETLAKAKASDWFWNGEFKAHPGKWGIPTKFVVVSAKEQAL